MTRPILYAIALIIVSAALALDAAAASTIAELKKSIETSRQALTAEQTKLAEVWAELDKNRLAAYRDLWADGKLAAALKKEEEAVAALPAGKEKDAAALRLKNLRAELDGLGTLISTLSNQWKAKYANFQSGNRAIGTESSALETTISQIGSDRAAVDKLDASTKLLNAQLTSQNTLAGDIVTSAASLTAKLEKAVIQGCQSGFKAEICQLIKDNQALDADLQLGMQKAVTKRNIIVATITAIFNKFDQSAKNVIRQLGQ